MSWRRCPQLLGVVHVLTYGGHGGGGGRGDDHPVVTTTLWTSGREQRLFCGVLAATRVALDVLCVLIHSLEEGPKPQILQ